MTTTAVGDGSEFPNVAARTDPSYLVVTERGESGWGAYVPDLPGVVAAGESEQEVRSLIEEAIDFHLEGLRDEREKPPVVASWAFRAGSA